MDTELAIAVAQAGGLGSLPAACSTREDAGADGEIPRGDREPVNLNFFTHRPPEPNNAREHAWREKLKPITSN